MSALYSDPLVTIDDDGICVRGYGLFTGDKWMPWERIDCVRAVLPTVWNGRWKVWGTTNFITWLACDLDRPKRDTIFIARLHTQRTHVGFTVHDAARVKQILSERGQLVDEQGAALPRPYRQENRPLWRWGAWYVMLGALALVLGQVAYVAPRLPGRVGTHFNLSGQADAWGSPLALVLPMILASLLVVALFTFIGWTVSRTASAVVGRDLLWMGTLTLGYLLVLSDFLFRANLDGTFTTGWAPLYAVGVYLLSLVGLFVLIFRRLT